MRSNVLIFFFLFISVFSLTAQEGESSKLPEILSRLEQEFGVKFNYVVNDVKGLEVVTSSEDVSLEAWLNLITEQTDLIFNKITEVIISINKPSLPTEDLLQQFELDNVFITSYLVRGIDKSKDGNYEIDFSKFSLLPGQIETDVLQSVQSLPGIQSVDETVSNINIRGGSNDQNLVLWDDIKMYQSGHFFGLISVFNPQITKKVSVSKNGTNAAYSDGVSGIIAMHTDDKVTSETKGNIGVNFLSLDGFLDVNLGSKSSLQIAARRSLNDVVQTPIYDNYFERISNETQISNPDENTLNTDERFTFYDSSLRWLYEIDEKNKLRVNFITINNDLAFDESIISDQETASRTSSIAQNSIAGGIQYEHTWNERHTSEINVYETDYKLKANNVNIIDNQQFLQENTVSETSIKAIHRSKVNSDFGIQGGYHFIETGVGNLNEVDVPLFRDRKDEVIRNHAIFLGVNYSSHTKGLRATGGLRYNYIEKFKKSLLEPRLNVQYSINKRWTFEAQGEFKHQNISQIINFQNDFLGVEKRRWQLANNVDIPIIRSKQASLGVQYAHKGWLLDVTGYLKNVEGITARSQGFETKYEFERAVGSYSVMGADVLVRKAIGPITSWLSYGYMDNSYTFSAFDEVSFPSNFDITHAATLGITYDKDDLKLSVGLNYRTGKPTTIPVQENEVTDGIINYDLVNQERLDNYMRLDFSGVYPVFKRDKLKIDLGVSVLNILSNENTYSNFYRIDTNGNPQEFEKRALGLTTNAVIRAYFF